MSKSAPEINNTFFCIANRDEALLSAIVYSHINIPDHYSLIFGFSSVTIGKDTDDINKVDEHQISRSRAIKKNIELYNALNRIGGCEYLILIGLTDDQKSFLSFTEEYNVIDINTYKDIDAFLHPISYRESISCRSDQVFLGLQLASDDQLAISIDENAQDIVIETKNEGGLIIVENKYLFEILVAANYAISINAKLIIVESYDFQEKKFLNLIEAWREEVKKGCEEVSYNELEGLISDKIDGIQFENHDFVTFFTIGSPYSLIIDNIIPCSHVNIKLNPDFFIFNNIYFQNNSNIGSALVFSPNFFTREETDFVIEKLIQNNYHVSALIKEDATSNNFDNYVKNLPFNILHLCTHGNQSEGSLIVERYVDEFGTEHIFEYNLQISFIPELGKFDKNGEPLIKVTKLIYPKKLNGFAFGTKEFKDQKYPSSIFPKMFRTVPVKENKVRSEKVIVDNSHTIECYRLSHIAKFTHLSAGGYSPLIFNNICWSAYVMKDHIIAVGARGYIGTLWAVNNDIAKKTAESFYSSVFDKTVLDSIQESLVHSNTTDDRNIYIYYGLHFTSIQKAESIEASKLKIADSLIKSIRSWQKNYNRTRNSKTKEDVLDVIKWNKKTLKEQYFKEVIKIYN